MKALVIYDSKFGNTEQVTQAIADTLGEEGMVQLISVDEADALELEGVDLLVLGGPTQRHGLSPAVRAWLELIPRGVMRGLFVAAFDTRYRMPRWKSGSAALAIARKLRRKGASLLLPAESFFVVGREGPLEDGELERAARWARLILERLEAHHV